MPCTPGQARALAAQLGPLYGPRPDRIPVGIVDIVLNGLGICQAVLDGMPRAETPQPLGGFVSTERFEVPAWGPGR